jgi:hypothetical protein
MMSFFNPFKSVILLPTKMGKIAQECLKWVNFTVKYFWAISLILVGKRITDLNGFKKTHHENG